MEWTTRTLPRIRGIIACPPHRAQAKASSPSARRDSALWVLYVIRALFTRPGLIILLPYLYFRYHTLRYTFDEEGIHMRVRIVFRREVNLTYARIQDIHLRSGVIQRWLGLADIQIQTASGSADAELVIEGFKEYEAIRDFLYTRMRGYRAPAKAAPVQVAAAIAKRGSECGSDFSPADDSRRAASNPGVVRQAAADRSCLRPSAPGAKRSCAFRAIRNRPRATKRAPSAFGPHPITTGICSDSGR